MYKYRKYIDALCIKNKSYQDAVNAYNLNIASFRCLLQTKLILIQMFKKTLIIVKYSRVEQKNN